MSTFHLMEQPDSRTGDNESQVRKYVATGSNDEVGVRLTAFSMTPPAILTDKGFLYRQNIVTDSIKGSIVKLSVIYGKKQQEEGSWTWSADSTGGSVHIKVSKQSVARFPDTEPAGNQLIGDNGDEVAGADIVIPTGKIDISYTHPKGMFTMPYFFAAAEYTGVANSATMFTRPAGEILFMGLRGSDGTDAPANVSYSFAYSKNLQGGVVDAITGIQKDGWDISWIKYADDDGSGSPRRKAKAVYVERVYDRANLAAVLGFGG